jgi:hypothetical protein
MTAQDDDYPFTDMDKRVSRLATELSRLPTEERLSVIRVACETIDELDYIAVDLTDYVRSDRADTRRVHGQMKVCA